MVFGDGGRLDHVSISVQWTCDKMVMVVGNGGGDAQLHFGCVGDEDSH